MSHPLRKAALSAIGSSLLVATLGLAPVGADQPEQLPAAAAAHQDEHKPADRHEDAADHDGDADADASTAYTEDTDTNDGGTANNVADEGDNAHPSGRDRSVEHGNGGNQGRSESDPDDDGRGPDRSNGGPDKPNGTGGEDLADQDGNNGCGNDDDFEDDNEGWCGKPEETAPEQAAATQAEPAHTAASPCPNGTMTRPCHTDTHAAAAAAEDEAEVEVEADAHVEATVTTADSAEHRAGFTCPAAGDVADDDMPAFCHVLAANDADEDEDDDEGAEVLGMESEVRGAGAEAPAATVSARSGGGALLTSLPVVGSLIEGELPLTGISTLSFLIVAMAAMVIGFLLVRASRRTKVGATS